MTLSTTDLSNVPLKQPPLLDNGYFSQPWVHFFQFLFNRVGGNTAPSNAQIAAALNSGGGSAASISVGASPYIYQAPAIGSVVVSGGGLKNVEVSRDGITYFTVGNFRGMFPLSTADRLRVTYTVAPTMTFIPR